MPLDLDMPIESVLQIPLTDLHESPFQPRQSWDAASQFELVASVRERGVLQPVLVRPHPKIAGEYEIVFGHRRVSASRAAPLETVPAIVRQMTDDDVRIAQAIENLQRADLTPLDEARQYQALQEALKVDQKTVAARVGKSEAHVSQRLRLLTAEPAVQAAVAAGEISAEVAQLIARQPKARQAHRLEEAKTGGASEWDRHENKDHRYPMTVDQLRLCLKLKSTPLSKAVFDTTDAKLLPKAGACTTCPHRSGNSPDHAAGEDPNRCGDTDCFEKKEAAHYTAKKKALQAANVKVLDSSKRYDVEHKLRRGELVDLTQVDPAIDKTRTLAEVLGNHQAGAVALTDYSGSIKTIAMAPGALQKALKAAGVTAESKAIADAAKKAKQSETTTAQRAPSAGNVAYEKRRQLDEAVRDALCAAILAGGPQAGDLADLVLHIFQVNTARIEDLKRMLGGKDVAVSKTPHSAADRDKLDKLATPVLARALMQLLVWDLFDNGDGLDDKNVTRLLKRYAVDPEPIREKVYGPKEPELDVAKVKAQALAVAKAAKKAKK